MERIIKIGTRASELAMYQANLVSSILLKHNIKSEIIQIDSEGDINLKQPIYKLGFSGVFTKSLDTALINKKIDIAVHSLKDVPTDMAENIHNIAVLERADSKDILKYKGDTIDFDTKLFIGTGSIRRKAQWLNKYPNHAIEGLRGNVNTRLKKIDSNTHWNGAIFAKAGLKRINLLGENFIDLDWMIPAPAQGAIAVASRIDDNLAEVRNILNHEVTELCTTIERDFMNAIQAGCSSPIGAIVKIEQDDLHFTGLLISLDGKQKAVLNKSIKRDQSKGFGVICAAEMKAEHQQLINDIKLDLDSL